jgi:hypothetical protein
MHTIDTSTQTFIDGFLNTQFSFENQFLRASFIAFMPNQSNASFATEEQMENNKGFTYAQLKSTYKSSFNRVDDSGEVLNDNATTFNFKLKFPRTYLDKNGVTLSQFKTFFDENFVGKRMVFFPTLGETQSSKGQGDKRIVIPYHTESEIHPDFDLKAFMEVHKKDNSKTEKKA